MTVSRSRKAPVPAGRVLSSQASRRNLPPSPPSRPGKGEEPGQHAPARLSHIDAQGRARMVDVSAKAVTRRVAVARGEVRMQAETLHRIQRGQVAKGEVLAVARVAGIMAAKRTPDLIPLCHPLPIQVAAVDFSVVGPGRLQIEAPVTVSGQTGVEMEALAAVSAAALTIYDMCKAIDRAMVISDIRLIEKRGGRSGRYRAPF